MEVRDGMMLLGGKSLYLLTAPLLLLLGRLTAHLKGISQFSGLVTTIISFTFEGSEGIASL